MTNCTNNEQQDRATSDFSKGGNTMTSAELKKALEEQGLNQSQFAALVGFTEKSVSFWMNDRAPIPDTIPLIFHLMRENKTLRDELEQAKQRIVAHFFSNDAPKS